jgi:hypothetical protein
MKCASIFPLNPGTRVCTESLLTLPGAAFPLGSPVNESAALLFFAVSAASVVVGVIVIVPEYECVEMIANSASTIDFRKFNVSSSYLRFRGTHTFRAEECTQTKAKRAVAKLERV